MSEPQHLDRLGAMDASFLIQEGPTSHAHVGGVVVVEGPPPRIDEMRAQIGSRLHLVPRYRQRLAHTALDRARPVEVVADAIAAGLAELVARCGLHVVAVPRETSVSPEFANMPTSALAMDA